MKILIDMNLSPTWVDYLNQAGIEASHWTTVGEPRATDQAIMEWAHSNGYIVFTNDLDFGALLAATRGQGPSVIQACTQDLLPAALGDQIIKILNEFETLLQAGALITVDEIKARVRILPLA